jgi:predicted dehydrogenase
MQKQQLNWGIIGCGDVTELKSGPAFNLVQNSKLYAVMRRNAEKAADYARRHDVPVWYSSAEALINDPQVNAIYVATPPSTHEAYTIAALQAGKPVYVEKPVALSASSCRIMAAAAEKYNVKLSVAHYRRALPYFNKIKELIKGLGEIRFANISFYQQPVSSIIAQSEENWRVNPEISGGGLFHDMAPHHIDLLNWFFGYPIAINGYAYNQAGMTSADDVVAALLAYLSFPITGIWNFNASRIEDRCEIVGALGQLSFAFHGNEITFTKNNNTEKFTFIHPKHIQQPMIEAVVKYFIGDSEENPCSIAEGIDTMSIIDQLTGNKFG